MNTETKKDLGPRVFIPPPLFYLAGFIGGVFLDYNAAIWSSVPSLAAEIFGVIDIALGFALVGWGMGWFAKNKTGIVPVSPASKLVMTGPYRFTRNPMYVGLALAYMGGVLIMQSAWALILLLPVMWVIRYYVIAREEKYLHALFGQDYVDYCLRVRRWF